ncbi:DUF3574 domain-containing protein [Variovorax sp. JS1663]|uniref:DUF3574 domain-containing protein n=1 Tax=Variovorax sp. JS1663 TaxID=1851577 RepID=UPI001302B6BC|nr:DUF3574 domain-containing protein [Variovorax sp. JS1663]
MPPLHHLVFVTALAVALGACASLQPTACRQGEQALVQDTLYLGTGKPQGGVVTPQEWDDFLQGTVTPRFPQGLSVLPASGQWRGADGAIVRENSYLLQLVHPDDEASDQSVGAIAAAYKSRFQQEAVLRARSRACVSF